jgi:hypothetical protein
MKDMASCDEDLDDSRRQDRENKIFDLVLNMNSTSKPTSLARAPNQGAFGATSTVSPAVQYQSPANQMQY